ALLLGNRYHQRLHQGHLQAAHHPFHRGAAVPIRAGQRLDHGSRHCRSPWLELGGNRGMWPTVRIIGALQVMWPRRWTEEGVWRKNAFGRREERTSQGASTRRQK